MALRTSDDTESKSSPVGSNPGQEHYDREFQKISDREKLSEYENDFSDSAKENKEEPNQDRSTKNLDKLRNAEDNPAWKNNVSDSKQKNSKSKAKFWKKGGPIAAILTVVFGGAVGIGFFGGSSLFIVNISEVLENKFNTSLASLDDRSNRIIALRTKNTISGVCSKVVSLACKYGKLSAAEIDGFEKSKINIVDSKGKVLTSADIESGKVRPANYRFNGKDIPASEFPNEMKINPEFKNAVQSGLKYNARVASVSGKVWQLVESALKVSKKAPFSATETTDEERLSTIQTDTKEGATLDPVVEDGANPACKDPNKCTGPEAEEINAKNKLVAADLAVDPNSETKAVTTALDEVGGEVGTTIDAAASSLKVTGVADTACSIYSSIKAVAFAAKTVRAAQLARYAMVFLTTASMIKAGDADAGSVAFLAGTLTALYAYTDIHGKTTKTAGTDTLAYRNAAFGDTGNLDTTANQFLAGGGLVGDISGVLSSVVTILGGPKAVNTTCGVLSNPLVQAGSLIIGVAAWIFPGSDVAMGAKEVAQIGGGVTASVVEGILPGMLKDIIAGNLIDKSVIGAAAMDAVVAGAGAVMSTNAQYSANAPLTPDQAVAYNDYATQVANQYAAQDRVAANPLNAADPNTFMGTIFTNLTRYSSAFSSVSDALSSSASILTDSLSGIVSPQTKAVSAADYQTCQDIDYQNMGSSGIATDLFCNPFRGIPPQYLAAAPDPDVLSNQLAASGYIDPTTGEPLTTNTTYQNLITNCINRSPDTPLGDGTNGADDGSDCIITDQTKANLYIHYIDQRAVDQMDNGVYDTTQTATANPTDTALAVLSTTENSKRTSSKNAKSITNFYLKNLSEVPTALSTFKKQSNYMGWNL